MSKDNNLETFTLVWLNVSIDDFQENIHVEQRLRALVNRLKIFHCMDDCERYVHSLSKEDRIVLIVSGHLTSKFISHLRQLRQICSVYFYNTKQSHNGESIPEIFEVISISTFLDLNNLR